MASTSPRKKSKEKNDYIPSRELTCMSHLGKFGKSSTQGGIFRYVGIPRKVDEGIV